MIVTDWGIRSSSMFCWLWFLREVQKKDGFVNSHDINIHLVHFIVRLLFSM